jgi:hypothetical protein
VADADPALLILFAVTGLAAASLVWLRDELRGRRARRAFRWVRQSTVRDAPDGKVHLRGRVRCDGPLLEAPVSGRQCVFHEVLIQEGGRVVLRQLRGVVFDLEDETGLARVVFADVGTAPPLLAGPRGLECVVPHDRFQSTGWSGRVVPRINSLMSDHGVAEPGSTAGRNLVAREGVILPGDSVAILGMGAREVAAQGAAGGYRTPPSEYVVRGTEDRPMLIFKLT